MVSTQNRHVDQWNRLQSPETNPHTGSQLILARIYNGEKTVFLVSGIGKVEQLHANQ